jgi:streptogramin lyase
MKFDPDENWLETFALGVSSPMAIARDASGALYVSGGSSHNIVKFDTGGDVLAVYAHPDLTGPQGIAFDEHGHFFSSSFYQNKIVEFDADGTYVRTITEGGLHRTSPAPRDC